MTKVRSFQDYLTRIRQVAEAATPATALRFCAWTLRRFPELFGDDVWDGLTPAETGRLREMLRAFDLAATEGAPLPADRVVALELDLLAFGPTDDDDAPAVHPDAIEFRGAVWPALEYCRTQNIDEICALSERLMNSLDYNLDPRPEGCGLDNLFTFPRMQRELEAHLLALAGDGRPGIG